jgi:hypothetical protein
MRQVLVPVLKKNTASTSNTLTHPVFRALELLSHRCTQSRLMHDRQFTDAVDVELDHTHSLMDNSIDF